MQPVGLERAFRALQAVMFYSALKWAANLQDLSISLGFDPRRPGGHMQKLLLKHKSAGDRLRDGSVDTSKWRAFVEIESALESELHRFHSFRYRLDAITREFPESAQFNAHLLDVYFRFYLGYESRKSITDNEVFTHPRSTGVVDLAGPGKRSKWSQVWLDQEEFQLPVLSRDPKDPNYQLMPLVTNKWDIVDPYVNIIV